MARSNVDQWLRNMPIGRKYKVDERQAEIVKDWMQDKEYYGGISFNADFSMIYRSDITGFLKTAKVKTATNETHNLSKSIDGQTSV